ncbi:hypothetical protein [Pengzhenrongella frigida]|uniref:Uncharacterized protein n=1 Tax=Pengzhenrongella frigida TaxID=1259133 RepID=A0A4Q5N0N7_9MICO|nr:hypothetical protein [Cellulomonas sp. HLT2-17]RYV50783.1 hypothetical protein EUA98_11560 [Cellulomonas sp. HLT2-17]
MQWFGLTSGQRLRDRAEAHALVTPDGGTLAFEQRALGAAGREGVIRSGQLRARQWHGQVR